MIRCKLSENMGWSRGTRRSIRECKGIISHLGWRSRSNRTQISTIDAGCLFAPSWIPSHSKAHNSAALPEHTSGWQRNRHCKIEPVLRDEAQHAMKGRQKAAICLGQILAVRADAKLGDILKKRFLLISGHSFACSSALFCLDFVLKSVFYSVACIDRSDMITQSRTSIGFAELASGANRINKIVRLHIITTLTEVNSYSSVDCDSHNESIFRYIIILKKWFNIRSDSWVSFVISFHSISCRYIFNIGFFLRLCSCQRFVESLNVILSLLPPKYNQNIITKA
jgi:hypothetical protein